MTLTTYPLDRLTLPNPVNLTLASGVQLLGYAMQTAEVKAGAPMTLDLYWATNPAVRDQTVTLKVVNGDERLPLWQGRLVAQDGTPVDSLADQQVLCRRVRFSMPATLPTGNYLLDLASGAASVNFATIVVKP